MTNPILYTPCDSELHECSSFLLDKQNNPHFSLIDKANGTLTKLYFLKQNKSILLSLAGDKLVVTGDKTPFTSNNFVKIKDKYKAYCSSISLFRSGARSD